MNNRIFLLITENLMKVLNLPKYAEICKLIDRDTIINDLPVTPVKKMKFISKIVEELELTIPLDLSGSIADVVGRLDKFYTGRFFSEVWKPSTDSHVFTGWGIVNEINSRNPQSVLDYGCGYNQFKDKITGLIGIDPYNTSADYMVDIFDFSADPESFDAIMILGSLNFNSQDEIESQMKEIVRYLKPNGYIYARANPGISWPNGKYVDIFPWTFEFVTKLAKDNNLTIESFKIDTGNNGKRFYFVYQKV